MPAWLVALSCVGGAFALAIARFVREHLTFREADAAVAAFWARFWTGRTPVRVRVVGARGARVALGRASEAGERALRPLVSAGFTLRTDDGRTVDVPPGTEVVLSAWHRVTDGVVEVAAGIALMARLDDALVADDGPHRRGGALRIPADGLMLSDHDVRRQPAAWARRTIRWPAWAVVAATGAAIVAATAASTRFVGLAFLYLLVLGADALLMHGGMIHLACTRPPAPDEALAGPPPGADGG